MAIRLFGGRELADLVKDLKEQADGKERAKALTRNLRGAAKPYVPRIKSAIQRMPSKGHGRRKGRKGTLHSEMSRAVTLQVRTTRKGAGVSIFMNPKKMPDGAKALPAYFEKTPGYTDLIHPRFGHHDKLIYQAVPAQGYFTHTIEPIAKEAEKAIEQVVDQVIKDLES